MQPILQLISNLIFMAIAFWTGHHMTMLDAKISELEYELDPTLPDWAEYLRKTKFFQFIKKQFKEKR